MAAGERGGRKVIVVRQRGDDYHASIADRPSVWGCGESIDEAVGDLVRAHAEEFGIEIEHEDFPAKPVTPEA